MKIKFLLSTILLVFINQYNQAQTTYKIKNVKVDNVSIPDNTPIVFGSNPSILVRFFC
jgi:hypothetical protein